MRVRRCASVVFVLVAVLSLSWVAVAGGRVPARPAASPDIQASGTLLQVMRGILFPNTNVIFFAQAQDPASVKRDSAGAGSTDPLAGTYGGWEAIENSSIAVAEAANLLSVPGRVCSSGHPVPVANPDWVKFVQDLRNAGMAAYKAAQSKKQDAIVDVGDQITDACTNCHRVYREKTPAQGGLAARCTK